tara:strand:- start:2678 stop:2911 length:234 start_codon:yes stop_codon:yes gene_type:complete
MNPFKITPSKISDSVQKNISIQLEFAINQIASDLDINTFDEIDLALTIVNDIDALKKTIVHEIMKQCHQEYNRRKGF